MSCVSLLGMIYSLVYYSMHKVNVLCAVVIRDDVYLGTHYSIHTVNVLCVFIRDPMMCTLLHTIPYTQ